ncbi:hypothetical protein V8C43DRAFT_288023 [Trichoderma afarasin]
MNMWFFKYLLLSLLLATINTLLYFLLLSLPFCSICYYSYIPLVSSMITVLSSMVCIWQFAVSSFSGK